MSQRGALTPAELAGRRVVVLGVGIDVAAALPVVVAAGPAELTVVDADAAAARATLTRLGLADVEVHADLGAAPPADVAVRSPGFSPYQPAVQERIATGLVTITPLGLWLSARGARPAVAITGTKGKSSTSVLAADALAQLGEPSVVLGNIGLPAWDRAPDAEGTPVLEISSYQAVDLALTAPVAALTAVGEDHVSWHGSVDRYLRDKAKVFTAPTASGRRWCGCPDAIDLPAAFAGIDFEPIAVPPDDLRGSNARVAAAVALAGAGREPSPAAVAELAGALLDRYPDLPGRFSTVATRGGVEYIDDALASNPLGLAAALRSLGPRPVTVIVGGSDRGASIEPVLAAVARRSAPTRVLCIDDAVVHAGRFRAVGGAVEVAADLEAAVELAIASADPGSVVVFSPGMPTPPAQGTWAERSARFRAAIPA